MPLNSPTDNTQNTPGTGTLYVVATPIGNLDDITVRALNILGRVDRIAAEDTRHTGRLLSYHNIKNNLISYHEHNEKERTPVLVHQLKTGSSIALVSNAGTPTVSDPGYRLIKNAIENNIKVVPIPGASAVTTALSIAGLPTDSFIFAGFPAKKKAKRIKQLKEFANNTKTLIFYQSPGRIVSFMAEMLNVMGDRYVVLCREMTKLHEECLRGSLSELIDTLSHRPTVKGECTLLVEGFKEKKEVSQEIVRAELMEALENKGKKLSEICKIVAQKYGLSKNKVYEEALKIKAETSKEKD